MAKAKTDRATDADTIAVGGGPRPGPGRRGAAVDHQRERAGLKRHAPGIRNRIHRGIDDAGPCRYSKPRRRDPASWLSPEISVGMR